MFVAACLRIGISENEGLLLLNISAFFVLWLIPGISSNFKAVFPIKAYEIIKESAKIELALPNF